MEVTTRTVRRDVTRLRSLGYPIDAFAGTDGGYRLGTGGRLPPLLLDDDEAVAIAVGLRVAATTTVSGAAAAVAALAKLDQVLPARLRERISALEASTVQLRGPQLPQVDADTLVTLATACRRVEGVRFAYRDHDGNDTDRSVEPYQIVHTGRRWYLVARDRDRRAWRTFRVDRIADTELTGHRFVIDDPPDAAALVSEGTMVAPWRIEGRVLLHTTVEEATRRYPPSFGVVEAAGDDKAILRIAANDLGPLTSVVAGIPWDFEVLDPPELRDRLRELRDRLQRSSL